MSDARPTRRAVLATGVAAVTAFIAGCGRTGASGAVGASASSTAASAAPTSAAAATSAAATTTAGTAPASAPAWGTAVSAAERDLVGVYTAVLKAHPALKVRLTPLLAAHKAHVAALASSLGSAHATTKGGSDEAISRLVQAEQKASDVAAKQCLTCPTSAAALLGSIAAANASHVVVLQSIGGS